MDGAKSDLPVTLYLQEMWERGEDKLKMMRPDRTYLGLPLMIAVHLVPINWQEIVTLFGYC